jgi:histidinol phosphatase-like enzyme
MPKDNRSYMKPLPGMVEKATLEFCIDRDQSYIIGDIGDSDMILAKNTGIRGILVRTCGGEESLIIKRLGGLMLKSKVEHMVSKSPKALESLLENKKPKVAIYLKCNEISLYIET